jgi:hypothetical protein
MIHNLAAKGMHYLIEIVNDWREKHHVDKNGDIVFQNKRLLTNVRFTTAAFHAAQQHSRGFENIPATIASPDEVWSLWEDRKAQKVVLRNYIRFGKPGYVVQTRDGVITDAFAVTPSGVNKYRKGLPLLI